MEIFKDLKKRHQNQSIKEGLSLRDDILVIIKLSIIHHRYSE
jgi:hypothetical protein